MNVIVIDEDEATRDKVWVFFILVQVLDIGHVQNGRIKAIMDWFKMYKKYDGKRENTIGFDERVFNRQDTMRFIGETREEF